MLKRVLSLVVAFVTGAALAAPAALNPDHPERYVVVKGDTLWDIAGRFLAKPWLWPEVWEANPQVANPHRIYPGDVLTLVYVDGRPRVRRGGTVKLSPGVRATPLETAIPTIPLEAIRPFLAGPRVLSQGEVEAAPYIVAGADEHLVAGHGDRVYVRGLNGQEQDAFEVFRPGEPLRDVEPVVVVAAAPEPPATQQGYLGQDGAPVVASTAGYPVAGAGAARVVRVGGNGEVLGYEAAYVGNGAVERGGDPATLRLRASAQEARIGDLVLPMPDERISPYILPHAPGAAVNGRIISVYEGVSEVGQYNVVAINQGARDGMEPGHVLAIWQAGQEIPDEASADPRDRVQLPDERAGVLLVFRTFERVSYGLVMRAGRAIHVSDYVRTPD